MPSLPIHPQPIPLAHRVRGSGGVLAALSRVLLWSAAASLLSACATQPALDALDYPDWLLSGERLFGQPIDLDREVPDIGVADPTDEMRAYVAEIVAERRISNFRFRHLIARLARDGYFNTTYSAHQTLTAAETFAIKGGNCLSYTNMFIALAREAGLDAVYQVVDVPPSWDADAAFLIRYAHINVLVKNVYLDRRSSQAVIVDFNEVHPAADFPRREVTDEYAKALYYANHSVAMLRAGSTREGFGHLRRAIENAPTNVDLWINLGAFYAVEGDAEAAVEAYHVALQRSRNNKAAFSGLARGYAALGNTEMAAFYQDKVRNYRETNPFYHFAMAQAAFEVAEFESSLDYINTAIGLNRRTARFHLLKGMVEQKLGDHEAAEVSFRRARRHGLDPTSEAELRRVHVDLSST
jgi:Flp pilus assembly protein TadD